MKTYVAAGHYRKMHIFGVAQNFQLNGEQRRATYIAIYRLTTIIGLSGHIVVYMLHSHYKHLDKSHWHFIHAVQAGKIIVGI